MIDTEFFFFESPLMFSRPSFAEEVLYSRVASSFFFSLFIESTLVFDLQCLIVLDVNIEAVPVMEPTRQTLVIKLKKIKLYVTVQYDTQDFASRASCIG